MSISLRVFSVTFLSSSTSTFGITKRRPVATTIPIEPTNTNGRVKPPTSYRNAPSAGPRQDGQSLITYNVVKWIT